MNFAHAIGTKCWAAMFQVVFDTAFVSSFLFVSKNSPFAAKHWADGSLNYGSGCAFGVLNGFS
jgi:hypothetical protein